MGSSLYQLIDSPTRITNTSSTLIDVIFTNCQNNIVSAGVSHVSLSDHGLVYAFRKISINPGGGGVLNRCLGREVRLGCSNPDPV